MLPEFLTLNAETVEEAVAFLSGPDDVKVIAGGTDLLVRMGRGEEHKNLLDITGIPGLNVVEYGNGTLVLGSAVTHRAVNENAILQKEAPGLCEACGLVGSPQIRNMGTIGGNLANASPAADSLAPLLVHDARVILESMGGCRRVALNDFIVGPYQTSMKNNELLTRIEIKGCEGYREGYRRVAKRAAWAISRLSVAWAIKEENGFYQDVRLAIGSCTPVPFRAKEAEHFLSGKRNEATVVAKAVEIITEEIKRATGMRPSFVYKIPVLEGLLNDVLKG
jgi:CO/xanthine dehydrogenase FAD-binding subunit